MARLRDPGAIRFMIVALGTGTGIPNGLADLGSAAFPAGLSAVKNPAGFPVAVRGALMALRFMVEDGSLNGRPLEQVREAVRERLSEPQDPKVASGAVRLAVVLGDPELRQTVETIATDRTAAEALVSLYLSDGVTLSRSYRRRVDGLQAEARLFLSGRGADIGPFRWM